MSLRRPLWLDLGDLGAFVGPAGPFERWQDHGLGLLRTIMHQAGVETALRSVRDLRHERELEPALAGHDLLLMNVRSYTFPIARAAAEAFKRVNPAGTVIVGGMHATVAPGEMEEVAAFDRICVGPAESTIVDLVRDPGGHPRRVQGRGSRSMEDWPWIDRRLWPRAAADDRTWPLEPECGWGPGPVATILTSRVCPWRCSFCNEASYIAAMGRRSPESVVDELNRVDREHGPIGSVVIHDSMFFQQPAWLERWLDVYPRRARRRWPYWAAARADTVRRWPDLFTALVRETNWSTISIGFESGSDRVLRILNKECTAEDNLFCIELLNRLGDEAVARGEEQPKFWANIMLGVPGETREDAFETMRMVRAMRHKQVSPALYAPYPGSALGYQLIAEGKSLLTQERYHRYPSDEKVEGVDYAFYRDLLAGRHDAEIARRPYGGGRAADAGSGRRTPHRFFLFATHDGRRKLLYGSTPEAALATFAERAGGEALASIDASNWEAVKQRDLQRYAGSLG